MNERYVSHVKREKTFSLVAAICRSVILIYTFVSLISTLKNIGGASSSYIVIIVLNVILSLYLIVTGILSVISLFKRKRSDIYLIAQAGGLILNIIQMIVFRYSVDNGRITFSVTGFVFLAYLILYKVLKDPKYRPLLAKLCFVPAAVAFVFWIISLPAFAAGSYGGIAQMFFGNMLKEMLIIAYMLFLCMFLSPLTQVLRRDIQFDDVKSGQDTSGENAENNKETKQNTDDKL